jgi:Fe2+ transport system protein B
MEKWIFFSLRTFFLNFLATSVKPKFWKAYDKSYVTLYDLKKKIVDYESSTLYTKKKKKQAHSRKHRLRDPCVGALFFKSSDALGHLSQAHVSGLFVFIFYFYFYFLYEFRFKYAIKNYYSTVSSFTKKYIYYRFLCKF